MIDPAPAAHWYLAQLKPGGLQRARLNLQRQGYPDFMPVRRVTARQRGRLQTLTKPLFPGYLFVRVAEDRRHWRSINATYGVSRLVALDDSGPKVVPDAMIEALKARCDDHDCIATPDQFAPGDTVRVVSGPFAELVARIEAVPDNQRVFVLLEMMGQAVRASLDPRYLEKT